MRSLITIASSLKFLMPLNLFKQKRFVLPLVAVLFLSARAFSADSGNIPELRLSPVDHPAVETLFVPSIDDLPTAETDPAWYVRTGAKKGLSGQADTDQELSIAPDTAILNRGFSAPWPAIMAAFQEPVAQVRPGDIAGKSNTKPLLIIPSGALSGTEESSFFKDGLAEYVNSGGTIFCLTQRNGSDFSALPVSQGRRLEAAGWSQDAGPLFRMSTVRAAHPLLTNMSVPAPSIETDGYFISYPAGSEVLLARPDGFATMIVYPVGRGWVVATTLFTDFSFLVGNVEPDEKILIRNLLSWTKDSGKPSPASLKTKSSSSIPAENNNRQADQSPMQAGTGQTASSRSLAVRTAAERKGDLLKLSFEVAAQPGFGNQNVLLRTGGQEKPLMLSKDKAVISFEIPVPATRRRVSFAVYDSNGRSLARGSVAVPDSKGSVVPGQTCYTAGDAAAVNVAGLGKGEITLSGLGFLDDLIIADRGTVKLPVPRDLPSGTYRMQWSFEEINDNKKQGEFAIDLRGYRVAFEKVTLERKREGERLAANAKFTINATQKVSGQLSVMLRGPGGKTVTVAEPVLSLIEGRQSVPVAFSFTPDSGGIWEMVYNLFTTLPEGAGIPAERVALAGGSLLFDAGSTAVLAIVPDNAFYYEPSGPVDGTAIITGRGRAVIEVNTDDKQVSREKVELTGISRHRFSLTQPAAGTHTLRVSAADSGLTGSREHILTYGLRLPDLNVTISAGPPKSGAQGPVMPVSTLLRNQGKSPAGASRIALYEGDPANGGKLIATIAAPQLAPKGEHSAIFDWPLYAKAGMRTLYAVADAENEVKESNKNNNTAAAHTTVPDLLLTVNSEKSAFGAEEPVSLPVSAFNLTTRAFRSLNLDVYVGDRSGKAIASERIFLDELSAKSGKAVTPAFKLASQPVGSYRFSARISRDKELAAVGAEFRMLPSLLLTGAFKETPAAAVLCKPFTVRYKIKNAGNIPPSGTVRLEIIPAEPGRPPVYSKQFPLMIGESSVVIDSPEFREGVYKVRLTASAANAEHHLTREFTLAEQTTSVSGPLDVRRVGSSFPRVLLWLGREGRLARQAVSETIVKQAFEQEDLYYKTVDSEEDFVSQAMTGTFNTYVLFEPQEMPAKTDWLKDRLERGQGVVIIGSGEITRAVAEEFGFTFEESSAGKGPDMLTLTENTGLGLSGNLPVNGKTLYPQKRGTKSAAVYSSSNKPAALIDVSYKGKIVLMPLSLSESAFQGGPVPLYSLVVRKAAFFAAPETEEAGGHAAGQLAVSSPGGPTKARVREVLPSGSQVLWTNADGKGDKNTITYELKADREPRKLLYLYQPSVSQKGSPVTEIYYECGGAFMSQGKMD